MIAVIKKSATEEQRAHLVNWIRSQGIDVHISDGQDYTVLGLIGDTSKIDMDLIARRVIVELEGEEGFEYIDEYRDASTERGKKLRQTICDKFQFASLEFQTLEGLIEAIGVEPCKLCTYCWNGKE